MKMVENVLKVFNKISMKCRSQSDLRNMVRRGIIWHLSFVFEDYEIRCYGLRPSSSKRIKHGSKLCILINKV